MHEPPGMLKNKNKHEKRLQACLHDQYGLSLVTLELLPLGKDFDAAVYRVVSEQGTAYFLKVTSRSLYEPACLVPRYLHDQGITSVVAPLPTKSNTLWTRLDDWTVIVYPFISGECSLTGMTNEQWKEVGAIFKRIHQVRPEPEGFSSLHKETFDPTTYTHWVRTFETQHLSSLMNGSASQLALHASWVAHQSTIHTAMAHLQKLAEVLRSRTFPYVICHADLHARNLIREPAGHVFVIDWDEVMLAPKERDFIFIRRPQAAAFWQGYGAVEIDWTALAYYLWERVVQDMIYYAQNVCFRDDWTEETRAEVAQMFHVNLSEGANLNAAYEASAHLI
jgi:spectinomycin phosphotransferase